MRNLRGFPSSKDQAARNDPAETAKAATIALQAFGDEAVMYPGPSYLGLAVERM